MDLLVATTTAATILAVTRTLVSALATAIAPVRLAHILSRIDMRQGEGAESKRVAAIPLETLFLIGDAMAEGLAKADPDQEVVVKAIPKQAEESSSGGYYDAPALDGSRPGTYWINLRDTAIWPSFSLKTLTYHEANPGHHLQVAVSRRLIQYVPGREPSSAGAS